MISWTLEAVTATENKLKFYQNFNKTPTSCPQVRLNEKITLIPRSYIKVLYLHVSGKCQRSGERKTCSRKRVTPKMNYVGRAVGGVSISIKIQMFELLSSLNQSANLLQYALYF